MGHSGRRGWVKLGAQWEERGGWFGGRRRGWGGLREQRCNVYTTMKQTASGGLDVRRRNPKLVPGDRLEGCGVGRAVEGVQKVGTQPMADSS